MYDTSIIVHYQPLNDTIVPSLSSAFYCLYRYIKIEPNKMASDSKMKVGKTETIIRLSNRNEINRTLCQCHSPNLPTHPGQHTQEHTIHQRGKEAGGTPYISE